MEDYIHLPFFKVSCAQLRNCPLSPDNFNLVVPFTKTNTQIVQHPMKVAWIQGEVSTIINQSHLVVNDFSGGLTEVSGWDLYAYYTVWLRVGLNPHSCSWIAIVEWPVAERNYHFRTFEDYAVSPIFLDSSSSKADYLYATGRSKSKAKHPSVVILTLETRFEDGTKKWFIELQDDALSIKLI